MVLKTAGDFISQYVGGSQKNTVDILESAKGKVLVIDEAYNLNDQLYGNKVLDVIVEKIQGTVSDDIAVLLLGYENQMMDMMRQCNPGLARRFAMDYAFYFDDYSPEELLQIYLKACEQQQTDSPMNVTEEVLRRLKKQQHMSNFGNAGAVDLILRNALAKASNRYAKTGRGKVVLEIGDVTAVNIEAEEEDLLEPDDPLLVLDSLYRMGEIKKQFEAIKTRYIVAQMQGDETPDLGHFVFRGSPGTGR